MAIHTHNTPSGVNEPGCSALRLLAGGADRPPGLLGPRPELPPEPLLIQAQALHARRALEDAIHHGAALLAALGVSPVRCVPAHAALDPDRLAAVADAIDLLDALNGPGEDFEEDDDIKDESDLYEDGADAEPSLARPEGHQWEIGGDLDHELPIGVIGAGLPTVERGLHG